MKAAEVPKTELEKRLEREAEREAQLCDKPEAPEQAIVNPNETRPSESSDTASEAAVTALVAERDALKGQILRLRADFDNYKKRVAREAEQNRKNATGAIIQELLPVADNLERALEHANDYSGALAEGVELVLRHFHEVLNRNGVNLIPAMGEPFNPEVHEAVIHRESDEIPADCVAQEIQKGYRLGDRVLRPTRVAVSAGPPGKQGHDQQGSSDVDSSSAEPTEEAAPDRSPETGRRIN
ncbi:MAG: nucleotide exchange factor GrpE [Candidatus Hydrogenedentes bacterium]|nr:nucleotide exchange factor GrpE [Candidatus Hydrogenedentota bacterium]